MNILIRQSPDKFSPIKKRNDYPLISIGSIKQS